MRSTRPRQARLLFSSLHLLNCSPPHLLYFFACGEKIGATRFELATSRSRTVRSIQAELRPAIACSIDLSDLAGSVNCINSYRDPRGDSPLAPDFQQVRAVPVVFEPFS